MQQAPPPPANIVRAASRLAAELGAVPAARALGVSREALARLAAGLPVRAGTIALAERALARSAPPSSSPPAPSSAAAAA